MKALVVDDEAPARRRLVRMLESIDGVEVIGQLEDGDSVLRVLESCRPDVLFLDVQMPGLSGMSLARQHEELPAIVFVTAHDHYAVEAFNVQAVDYLLKPVRAERLQAAVERVRARQGEKTAAQTDTRPAIPRVVSTSRGLIRLFDAREITRFWSSDKYTLFRADGAEQMTEEPLLALEQRLLKHGFTRVHRAELIRTDAVRALRSEAGSHEVVLSDGQVARVSRRALAAVRSALGLDE